MKRARGEGDDDDTNDDDTNDDDDETYDVDHPERVDTTTVRKVRKSIRKVQKSIRNYQNPYE